ncbi:hypothetical protein OAQ99_06945 [Candidatus Kapabacteria bacterium]|nr:hypothetical protein [Candidatus Kapabacteria bacterium]
MNFLNMMVNKYLLYIIILFSISLEIFSQGFPLNELFFEPGFKFDYLTKYNILTKVKSDTNNTEYPVKYSLNLPYIVNQNIDSEYELKLEPKNIRLEVNTVDNDPIIINYKDLKTDNRLESTINIDKKGRVLEYITNSENDLFNDVIKILNTYSTGMFLEFPINNDSIWTVEKPIIIESNGLEMVYNSTYKYSFVGNHKINDKSYFKVDFELTHFKLDITKEESALINRLMETNFDFNGYYLIDKNTGLTNKIFSEGSIRTIFDLGEFKALVSGDKYYSNSNLMMMNIMFEGESFIRY